MYFLNTLLYERWCIFHCCTKITANLAPEQKQDNFIISVSVGREVGDDLVGSCAQGLTKPKSGCRWGLRSPVRFGILFHIHWLLAHFGSLQFGELKPSSPRSCYYFLPCGAVYCVQLAFSSLIEFLCCFEFLFFSLTLDSL